MLRPFQGKGKKRNFKKRQRGSLTPSLALWAQKRWCFGLEHGSSFSIHLIPLT
jgi:hypothetical protein